MVGVWPFAPKPRYGVHAEKRADGVPELGNMRMVGSGDLKRSLQAKLRVRIDRMPARPVVAA